MSKVFNSIGAVLAGFLMIVVLDTGTDMLMQKLGIFPRTNLTFNITWMVALATAYRTLYAVAGSWLAAVYAPARPMRHALAVGVIGLLLNTAGYLMIYRPWEASDTYTLAQLTPEWYSISLAALSLPAARLGGRLQQMRTKHS